jgi:hypothetical protein
MRCGPDCRYGSAYPPRLSVKADLLAWQPNANWRPEQVQQSLRRKLRYSITSLARVSSVGGTGIDRAPSSG